MKKILLLLMIVVLLAGTAYAKGGHTVNVHGYTRHNGTYVAPHHRTAPNGTKADNWSTRGNVNPYTGKEGTKEGYGYGSSINGYTYNGREWVESSIASAFTVQQVITSQWIVFMDGVDTNIHYNDVNSCLTRMISLTVASEAYFKSKYGSNPYIEIKRLDAHLARSVFVADYTASKEGKVIEDVIWTCRQETITVPTTTQPVVTQSVTAPVPTVPVVQPAHSSIGKPILENWRKIKEGMTEEQVRTLLGKPSGAATLWGGTLVWYYSANRSFGPHIEFLQRDNNNDNYRVIRYSY
jgi:hypothetical protein